MRVDLIRWTFDFFNELSIFPMTFRCLWWFSTSVELESENVCVSVSLSVCHLKTLGDFKNGLIWLKFCTLVPWVNTWGCFFHFFKFLIFKGVVTSFSPKTRLKTLGQAGHFNNGSIWLIFCTLDPWVNWNPLSFWILQLGLRVTWKILKLSQCG